MKRILSLITLPLILLLFYNQAANWHYHKLPNGIVIEHAHPYSKAKSADSPFQKHTHNDFEILILGLLSTTTVILSLLFATIVLIYFPIDVLIKPFKNIVLPTASIIRTNPHRGPPTR